MTRFDDVAESPVGHALVGRSFMAWCFTPRLGGTVHFGQRDPADAAVLVRLYGLIGHRDLRLPLRRVVDGRDFLGVDDEAWALMVGRVGPRIDALRGIIERQAIIVRSGIEGVRVASFLPALGPGDAFRLFEDPAEAYAWADPEDGPTAFEAVEELRATFGAEQRVVIAARQWIGANLRGVSLEACARALGLSSRSLQRHLAATAVSFRALVREVRVEAARTLLLDRDAKVAAVAQRVGCSSASQLSVLLRRAGGSSPSEIRRGTDTTKR